MRLNQDVDYVAVLIHRIQPRAQKGGKSARRGNRQPQAQLRTFCLLNGVVINEQQMRDSLDVPQLRACKCLA
jgi:hypothetical protein